MAKILGLSFFFHDSAAAIVCDGQIVAAAAEERFSRLKHSSEFPKGAIDYCLEAASLRSINELDAIVFYEKPVIKLFRIVESLITAWPRGLSTFTRKLPAYLSSRFHIGRCIRKMLPAYNGPIYFTRHHLSHAASAFFCSPFDRAAILTMDGVGERETTTVGLGQSNEIKLLQAIHFPHSIGLLYSALTAYLGFEVNEGEWKVMGLAPYGKPVLTDQFRRLVRMRDDGSYQLDMRYFLHLYSSTGIAHNRRWLELFGFPWRDPSAPLEQCHMDLASSGQAVVEELILNLARQAARVSLSENLVIAGGVGLNGVANYRIEREGIFKNVWIQPAAGDDGGALGAALLVSTQLFKDPRCLPMEHMFWGPEFSVADVESCLHAREVPFEKYDDRQLIERAAQFIADGKILGWFRGRMEFGPRALGSRSLLADAANPRMKEIINERVKYRESFRPFAPAVPYERVHEYFDVPAGTSLPFMAKVVPVRGDRRHAIPAVTHEDGTARVQTVTRAGAPLFHQLLLELEGRTSVPVVLNTSFNVRGEPIVCSPHDAYECFINSGVDALALGNCWVTSKKVSALMTVQHAPHATGTCQPATRHLSVERPHESADSVVRFYRQMPFNYYSNAVDAAQQLSRVNPIKDYPSLHKLLKANKSLSVLDVGCGTGWFPNACAHYYGARAVGVDQNPLALGQARGVARLLSGCDQIEYVQADLTEYNPARTFDVVNSLGVVHHLSIDRHEAIRRLLTWVSPTGYFHLGLYHLYGRRPFLDHFRRLEAQGAGAEALLEEFRQLCPEMSDEIHLRSWFRDQVFHPRETSHTYEEIEQLLSSEGYRIVATSINGFRPLPSRARLIEMEKELEALSRHAIEKQRRYFPGFFVVLAKGGE
jgi:carbamoyltransferase